MRSTNVGVFALALGVSVLGFHVLASDLAKEQRWADQTVDSIIIGDAEWLQAGDHEFLGIYTESATDKSVGGAILMHGIGVHPNWTDVIHPLRTRLPEVGWHTLSLQMPILANEADVKDYAPLFSEIAPRVDAGIAFLKSKGIKNIVLIGHSMGATMASYFAANNDIPEVKAIVMVGATGTTFKDPERDVIQSLKKIKKPVLDLSGSEDMPDVLETQALKAETARAAGNDRYEEIRIEGANHFLVGKEDELVQSVGNWMAQFGES
jgi:predicted alpha/beta-hydrolase family hydrolase